MVREVSYFNDGDLRHGNVPMMPPLPPQNMPTTVERAPFNNPDHNVIILNKPSKKKRTDNFPFKHYTKRSVVAPEEYTIHFPQQEDKQRYQEFKNKVMKDKLYY